jgi:hypothetical protein
MRTKAYPYYIGVALIAGLILLIGVSAVSNKKPAVDQKLAKQAALLQEKQTLLKSQQESQ